MKLSFGDIIREVEKNIDFYSWSVSSQTEHEFDDVRQEIMIKVWKAKRYFEKRRGDIRNFFITVIKNHVRNMMKKKSLKCLSLDKEIGEDFTLLDKMADPRSNTLKNLEQKDLMEKIYKMLPDNRCRRVLVLLKQGNSVKAIAGKVGIIPSNIYGIITNKIKPVIDMVMKG